MGIYRYTLGLAALLCGSGVAQAYVLTFVAQFDSTRNATNYSWFFPQNWFLTDTDGNLSPAGRVPLANETALITGLVDAGISGVRVQTLVLTNQATVTNGTFSIEDLRMLSNSAFKHATINLVSFMTVSGTNCVLNASSLNMLGVSTATVAPPLPGGTASLILQDGSLVEANGLFTLADGGSLAAGGSPASRISITGMLASRGNATVTGAETNHLIINNSRLISVNDGILTFLGGIDWESTYGEGEFRAALPEARLVFASPFQVPAGVISSFTGPGVSRLEATATVDGVLRVGLPPGTEGQFASGQFQVESSLAGKGEVDVLGTAYDGALLRWNSGDINVPTLNVSTAGELQLGGTLQTTRRLAGCNLNNSGRCVFATPELVLEQGAQINNLLGGTFEISGDGTIKGAVLPAGGVINNDGTLLKTSTGLTAVGGTSPSEGPDFNNNGLVDIRSGELDLFGGTSGGVFQTEAGAVLSFWGGTHVLQKTASFTGQGTVRLVGVAAPALWLASEGVFVPTLQLGTNATVLGGGAHLDSVVSIGTLLVHGNGTLADGIYDIEALELLEHAQATNATVNVSKTLHVAGDDCTFRSAILDVKNTAVGTFNSAAPAAVATLRLLDGSAIILEGKLNLAGNSLISSEGQLLNGLALSPGAILSSTNTARIQASDAAHLLIDSGGLIRVDGGSLTFESALDFLSTSGATAFEAAAPDSLILFTSSLRVPPSNTNIFSGLGTTRLAAGAEISGRIQLGRFASGGEPQLKTGTLELSAHVTGTGAVDVLGDGTQGSTLAWVNGQLGTVNINVRPGAQLVLPGNQGQRELSGCVINNGGMFAWQGQSLTAGAGAALNVLPTGKLDIQQDGSLAYNQQPPRLTIRNSGTLIKSGGSTSTLLDADVYNSASLLLKLGTLQVQGALVQDSGNAELQTGTVLVAPSFYLSGGSLTGIGQVDANLDNAGIIAPGLNVGILRVANQANYQQAALGTLLLELGGTTPGVLYDQLVVSGKAALSGKLEIQLANGFVPQQGQSFDVLTCKSLSGKFLTVTGPAPLPSTTWVARYSETGVSLVLAGLATVSTPTLTNGQFSFQFPTTSGVLYHLQACSDLVSPSWEEVQTISGDGAVKTVSQGVGSGTQFFRIIFD